ncbi:Nucleoside-diphosphate-sugar epimerase [Nakamurella panacisegetis]|uniref:Nucleoside-diphosphate-sugar epimerase n=1 Tax=Nakamurella panacisegetis TaxID=1090615 RepID=A0A1H0RAG6_9ACTN|nr:NAD-dependent epimerase/dehydratase family protein [Nakamurella panacisegetis]SDP26179.1 Nucleoside-diphosphate-sugar epimerase [Nakamurella panacisegetis]
MSRTSRRVLYVGGTGTISAACVVASLGRGDEVHVLNRGASTLRPPPPGVHQHHADIRGDDVGQALAGLHFDAVVDFLCYTAADAQRAESIFAERTDQYIFISSATVYRKPVARFPTTESTALRNPLLAYARGKLGAEQALMVAFREREFPVTVVRPSHTYDDARPPFPGDWTVVDRILRGSEVVVSGDGTSPWTITHADDFAVGLIGLIGLTASIGEAFHITSDEVLTWDAIHGILAAAADVAPRLLHLSADLIATAAPDWRWSELIRGDLSHSSIFDTTKIRSFVPAFRPQVTWEEGARRILQWRAAHPDRSGPDPTTDSILDRLVEGYHKSLTVLRQLAP